MNILRNSRHRLKAYVRKNTFLYTQIKYLQYSFSRRDESLWQICDRDCDLCLESYPASASSFLYRLILYSHPALRIAHHTHAIASLKLSLKYNVPTVIIIRNPLDAVSSRVVRYDSDLEESISEYIDFYEFIIERIACFRIISFEDVINETSAVLKKITEETGFQFEYDNLEQIKRNVFSGIRELAMKRHGIANRIALPSSRKEMLKQGVKEKMLKMRKYKESESVFHKIRDRL